MRVEILSVTKPYFSMSWKLDPVEMKIKLEDWFREHTNVHIEDIKHDVVTSFWYPPQMFVTIYFKDK